MALLLLLLMYGGLMAFWWMVGVWIEERGRAAREKR